MFASMINFTDSTFGFGKKFKWFEDKSEILY